MRVVHDDPVDGIEDPAASWTVGRLRVELVGVDDDLPVVVFAEAQVDGTFAVRQVLVGAGYGEGIERDQPLLADHEFPLQARFPDD
jgi:hypothetical protein